MCKFSQKKANKVSGFPSCTTLVMKLRILRSERMNPWDTPVLIHIQLKLVPLLRTLWTQLFRQCSVYLTVHLPSLYSSCAHRRSFSFWFRDNSPITLDLELLCRQHQARQDCWSAGGEEFSAEGSGQVGSMIRGSGNRFKVKCWVLILSHNNAMQHYKPGEVWQESCPSEKDLRAVVDSWMTMS